jgi:hypothetical protein
MHPDNARQPLTLDTAGAAALLGIPARTLANWRSSGYGPRFVKLGSGGRTSTVRYRVAELERWLQARERRSTVDPGRAGGDAA